MIIKKISEEVTYIQKNTKYVFEVGGKPVTVRRFIKQDNINSDYENDEFIDEDDIEKLGEDEEEALNENLMELFDLKDGDGITIEL